jgi:hypothetical protein
MQVPNRAAVEQLLSEELVEVQADGVVAIVVMDRILGTMVAAGSAPQTLLSEVLEFGRACARDPSLFEAPECGGDGLDLAWSINDRDFVALVCVTPTPATPTHRSLLPSMKRLHALIELLRQPAPREPSSGGSPGSL